MTQSSTANSGDTLVLIGTRKGSFILSSGNSRKVWSVFGPHHAGSEVFHLTYDLRGEGTVYAAVNQTVWGPSIQRSHDLGQTWLSPEVPPRFASEAATTVQRLWHVKPGRETEAGVVYLGVEPAALFKSGNSGATWEEVVGLSSHPTRDQW